MTIPAILKPENIKRLMEIDKAMYILNMKDRWEPEDRKKYVALGAEREKLRRGE